jgi:phosphoglycolate phosphatase-like HAD superfamily hydrolase
MPAVEGFLYNPGVMTKAAALLDVDGTLIDSNDAHSRAWVDVGREFGLPIHFEDVRPLIGMGSDKVLPKLTGLELESPEGERLAKRHGEIYRDRYLPRLRVFHGTHALLERMAEAGLTLVIATSAGQEDLRAMLEHAKLERLIDDHTSSAEVDASKPDPDVVQAALRKAGVGPDRAVFLGDTPYDIEAATRAGVKCVALRCGGWWSDDELQGAESIYDDPADLLERWPSSAFGRLAGTGTVPKARRNQRAAP